MSNSWQTLLVILPEEVKVIKLCFLMGIDTLLWKELGGISKEHPFLFALSAVTLPCPLAATQTNASSGFFSCIEQPIWQSILTFSPKCQKLFIIREKTTSLSKIPSHLDAVEATDHIRENNGQGKFRWRHSSFVRDLKRKKVRLRLGKSLHASLAEMLFLLESVGTSDGPPLARMSKNNIIFPDSCWIEGKGYLFKLLKHEAKSSQCALSETP